MKKIRLFSIKANKYIEGEDAELYINFYLAFHRDFIFKFIINVPNIALADRNPIRLWKDFLMMREEENVKYMRRYENILHILKEKRGIKKYT